MSEYKIERKSKEFIKSLIDSGFSGGTYTPKGLFYCVEYDKDGKRVYVGVDNSTGDAWTEEFEDIISCKNFLEEKAGVKSAAD